MKNENEVEYLAVCSCGNVLRTTEPRDANCRCGNFISAEQFRSEDDTPYVYITGFRGEKIKCYQRG